MKINRGVQRNKIVQDAIDAHAANHLNLIE